MYDYASLELLAIKPKTWRDLVDETPFTRKDIVALQDPKEVRDLREYAYVKEGKKVDGEWMGCGRGGDGVWEDVRRERVPASNSAVLDRTCELDLFRGWEMSAEAP